MKVVFFALLAILAVAAAEIPDWCYDQAQVAARSKDADSTKRCEFYLTCLEAKYNCKGVTDADRYPVDYGHKYCKKFGEKSFHSQKGRDWRDATLTCLQTSFFKGGYMEKGKNKGNCHDLTEFEFGEHARCYTQPGASICELARPSFSDGGPIGRWEDAGSIALTVDGKDLLSVRSGKQILQVIGTCGGQILNYVGLKLKQAGHFLADEARKLYDSLPQGVKQAARKVKAGAQWVGNKVGQGASWVGNKVSQGWNKVTSIFDLIEVQSQLQELQKHRHLMAPEHADRLDKLTERVEALRLLYEALEEQQKGQDGDLPLNF